jgi:hypothetical protein
MNLKQEASELLERLRATDGIVITRQEVAESVLEKVFVAGVKQGKELSAKYVEGEIGAEHLGGEIRKLDSCF